MPVLRNIAQLATCPAENSQGDAGLLRNAALAWTGDRIEWVGDYRELPDQFRNEAVTDCNQSLVIPGMIDAHTHLCFGGWRGHEFELRNRGASYQEIAAAGGGIASTVAATRAASSGELLRKAQDALDGMLKLGVTTVEAKSGYGLDEANELKQLDVYRQLNRLHPVDVVATYLGAHIVPPEKKNDRESYIALMCEVMIPRIARQGLAEFCDAFVEENAYTLDEARRIFTAAQSCGLGIKVHADQLSAGGGAELAAEMGAVSAEHLEHISDQGITAMSHSGTVAVSLPLASLYLREGWLDGRRLIDQGVRVAVASDFNPGSAPSYHLPLGMTLACLNQGMTPQETLMGVTTVAARAIGREQSIGSLQPGYRADITIIDAPSLDHWLYHFRDTACKAVLKNGRWVYR